MKKNDIEKLFPLKSGHYHYFETNLSTFKKSPIRMDRGCIFLCLSGEASINIGLVVCKITKNVETVIMPDTTVSLIEISENFLIKGFVFSKEMYEYTGLRLGIFFSRYIMSVPSYLHPDDSVTLQSTTLHIEMAEQIHNERYSNFVSLMQRNFVQNFFLYLYDKCKSNFTNIEEQFTRQQKQFYKFLSLLDIHINDERNVRFYADKLCITPRYLRTITINATQDESPKALIDKRLMVEIKILLQDLDKSIQSIADVLNFPDQSYLCRYFKLHAGMSPSEYRRQISKNI